MAFFIRDERERTGLILLIDRKSDGTVIDFACKEATGTLSPVPDNLINDPSSNFDSTYRVLTDFARGRPPSVMRVDTTELLPGLITLAQDSFVKAALDSADRDQTRIALSRENRADFGFDERAQAGV